MTEISYLTQDGQKIYLKDATGREMLATKQPKLKSGNGIIISPDGTISKAENGTGWKTYTADNIYIEAEEDGASATFSAEFSYCGNLALLHSYISGGGSSASFFLIEECGIGTAYLPVQDDYNNFDARIYGFGKEVSESDEDWDPYGVDLIENWRLSTNYHKYSYAQSASFWNRVFGSIRESANNLVDTGEDYLYIITKKVVGRSDNPNSDGKTHVRESNILYSFFESTLMTQQQKEEEGELVDANNVPYKFVGLEITGVANFENKDINQVDSQNGDHIVYSHIGTDSSNFADWDNLYEEFSSKSLSGLSIFKKIFESL